MADDIVDDPVGSGWRWRVFGVAERACALTGHRWCPVLVSPVYAWADRYEEARRE